MKKKLTKLQELRAKSPFTVTTERKGRGRKTKGTASKFGGAINTKLNQQRSDTYAIEYQLKRTFGI